MDFCNTGNAFYHTVVSIYCRTKEGQLAHVSNNFPSSHDPPTSGDHALQRLEVDHRSFVVGLITSASTKQNKSGIFMDWFSNLVAGHTRLDVSSIPAIIDGNTSQAQASKITEIFDRTIRNVAHNDQWHQSGRRSFEDKVRFFTSRACKVEFCLPAFPCKSSNLNKVSGKDPDKGEELALRCLHEFVCNVKAEYSPGAKIWIISDGHVFSDCIGVDDETVNLYFQGLIAMNCHMESDYGPDEIGFLSMADLFFPPCTLSSAAMHITQASSVLHPIPTVLDETAETCRQILLAGCGADETDLREKIHGDDVSILKLYRGFSRFMLEDLATHPGTESLSRSQCRKLSSKVAFEMIKVRTYPLVIRRS